MLAFSQGKQWTYVAEREANGVGKSHKIKFNKDFWEEMSGIAFDIAHNLRAVLDQSAYASAIADGKIQPKSAYFPIGDDAAGLKNVIARKCKNLRPEIIALFSAFKPYKRGNLYLPTLNKLCNTKKHAILIPFRVDDSTGVEFIVGGTTWFLGYKWDPENYEVEILGMSGANFDRGGQFAFHITFNDIEPVLGGSEPLALLTGMAREVERVLMATEAECKRLGLIK